MSYRVDIEFATSREFRAFKCYAASVDGKLGEPGENGHNWLVPFATWEYFTATLDRYAGKVVCHVCNKGFARENAAKGFVGVCHGCRRVTCTIGT